MKRSLTDLTRAGWVVAVSVAVLLAIGVASIYGATSVRAGESDVTGRAFALRQTAFALVSLAAAAGVLRVGYLRIARHGYLVCAGCLLLLLPMLLAKLTHTSFGGLVPEARGAYRCIRLPGFQLQPSEFMKLGYILALAWYLRYRNNFLRFGGLLTPFLLTLIPLGMVLAEPDLGTSLLFVPVLFGMLFVAGARGRHLASIILAGVIAVPLLWPHMKPYQQRRVTAMLMQSASLREKVAADPQKYAFTGVDRREALEWGVSSGLQLVRSKAALGSGGLLGQGWGQGTYVEYNFLPDRHNDFVFAIVGHQWGLIGCLAVLACYVLLVLTGVEIASATTEPVGRLVAVGVVCLIAAQALINVGMTVGLMPVTGMTLPFVSYGGSSLLANTLAVALLISVAQHRPFMLAAKPFEWRHALGKSVPR